MTPAAAASAAPELLDDVIDIAFAAATAILEVYETDFTVRRKEDGSPVTDADIIADTLIRHRLARLTPDLPVISEETAPPGRSVRAGWHTYWLVDPLDGTRGFADRTGEFIVNIALVAAGVPVVGVMARPTADVCYSAAAGAGATRRARHGLPAILSVRPDSLPVVVATSRSRRNPLTRGFIESLDAPEVLRCGSALKSCLVAEGAAHVYPGFSPTSTWDTAAAQCVVEEAGGALTDVHFHPLRYPAGGALRNPRFIAFAGPPERWREHLPAEAVERP